MTDDAVLHLSGCRSADRGLNSLLAVTLLIVLVGVAPFAVPAALGVRLPTEGGLADLLAAGLFGYLLPAVYVIVGGLSGRATISPDAVRFERGWLTTDRSWACPVDALLGVELAHSGYTHTGYQTTVLFLALRDGTRRRLIAAGSGPVDRSRLLSAIGRPAAGPTVTEHWAPLAEPRPD